MQRMKMTRWLIALAMALFAGAAAAQSVPPAKAQTWAPYVNARFGVAADVPVIGFFPQPPSDNGDGQAFVDESGQIEFRIYGSWWNVSTDSFQSYRRQLRGFLSDEGARITYEPGGEHWFVFSGYLDDRIFYLKAITRPNCPAAGHMLVEFPAKMRPTMSGIIEHIEDSFVLVSSNACNGN